MFIDTLPAELLGQIAGIDATLAHNLYETSKCIRAKMKDAVRRLDYSADEIRPPKRFPLLRVLTVRGKEPTGGLNETLTELSLLDFCICAPPPLPNLRVLHAPNLVELDITHYPALEVLKGAALPVHTLLKHPQLIHLEGGHVTLPDRFDEENDWRYIGPRAPEPSIAPNIRALCISDMCPMQLFAHAFPGYSSIPRNWVYLLIERFDYLVLGAEFGWQRDDETLSFLLSLVELSGGQIYTDRIADVYDRLLLHLPRRSSQDDEYPPVEKRSNFGRREYLYAEHICHGIGNVLICKFVDLTFNERQRYSIKVDIDLWGMFYQEKRIELRSIAAGSESISSGRGRIAEFTLGYQPPTLSESVMMVNKMREICLEVNELLPWNKENVLQDGARLHITEAMWEIDRFDPATISQMPLTTLILTTRFSVEQKLLDLFPKTLTSLEFRKNCYPFEAVIWPQQLLRLSLREVNSYEVFLGLPRQLEYLNICHSSYRGHHRGEIPAAYIWKLPKTLRLVDTRPAWRVAKNYRHRLCSYLPE